MPGLRPDTRMTLRCGLEHLPASEDFTGCFSPESLLFSHPGKLDSWYPEFLLPDAALLTPPDTDSDCSVSDCPDMSAHPWSQSCPLEEPWTIAAMQDHAALMDPSERSPKRHSIPVTSQDLQALSLTPWLGVTQGPVDVGLSPALSHESQSSRTLKSFSEPDPSAFPAGLDTSLVGEPHWSSAGPNAFGSTMAMPQDAFVTLTPSPYEVPISYGPSSIGYDLRESPSFVGNLHHPLVPFQGSQGRSVSKRTLSGPPVMQVRPLFPRYYGGAISDPPTSEQYWALQYQNLDPAPLRSLSSVSTSASLPRGPTVPGRGTVRSPGYVTSMDPVSWNPNAGTANFEDFSLRGRPAGPGPYYLSPVIEDPPEGAPSAPEDIPSSGLLSSPPGHRTAPSVTTRPPGGNVKPILARPNPDGTPSAQEAIPTAITGIADRDDRRYRTHALYSGGPRADGLYHCPFEGKQGCLHPPTKLKCNYDKFVDSHLKPFRCKDESCAKLEFSSTACLLRHEREAHGMYGHGDRPHLCVYPGCERGIPGHGFPRRYNLFDHMKRVHDHESEPSLEDSCLTGIVRRGTRKASDRKRKAEEPAAGAAPTQRQKTEEHAYQQQHPSALLAEDPDVSAETRSDRKQQQLRPAQWAQHQRGTAELPTPRLQDTGVDSSSRTHTTRARHRPTERYTHD